MSELLAIGLDNLLSPPILFFALGFAAALLGTDLRIPEPISKAIALYLMFAIGFKGGAALAGHGLAGTALAAIAAGVALSFTVPCLAFLLLRLTTGIGRATAAAVAAHYGSVSVVTFVTATAFLDLEGVGYEPWLVAVVAAMETPAIITGLLLARERRGGPGGGLFSGTVLREVLLNGSIVMLLGAFAIGWATGEEGLADVAPFVVDPFKGVLCLFLLELGLVAARQLGSGAGLRLPAIAFGLYMPLLGATLGLLAGWAIGISLGGATLMAVLAGSASYIAVPAAMRLVLPQADPAVYLTLSLGVTFPFNVMLGIPLYLAGATALYGT